MQTLPFKQLIPNILRTIGAPDYEDRGEGLSPRRLPAWTRPQVPAPMDVMVRMPSGVRLEFTTDATELGIEFLATNMVTPPRAAAPSLSTFSMARSSKPPPPPQATPSS